MKHYIEISRNTNTRAQFAAQCRAALRKTGLPCYIAWADDISCAFEEMDMIEAGKREPYRNTHKADDERQFDEISACNMTSYQVYYTSKTERAFYNFNLEWDDGHGYFYCIDSVADEQTEVNAKPEEPADTTEPITIFTAIDRLAAARDAAAGAQAANSTPANWAARNTYADMIGVMSRASVSDAQKWASKIDTIIAYVAAGHYAGNYEQARKILNRRKYNQQNGGNTP